MTPFQFVGQNTEDELREKQQHLLRSVKSRKISVSYHDSHTSFLEAVFAKGDRRLSRVLVEAYRRGCCFDGWDEQFRYDTWLEVFRDLGFDTAFLREPHHRSGRGYALEPPGLRREQGVLGAGIPKGRWRADHAAVQPRVQRLRRK